MRDDYISFPSEKEYSLASVKDELDSLHDEIYGSEHFEEEVQQQDAQLPMATD